MSTGEQFVKKHPWAVALIFVGMVLFLGLLALGAAIYTAFGEHEPRISRKSVLLLEVKGIITDSKKFVKDLKRYRDDHDINAVVVRLDSPGGVVGPSQEMYDEILRTRQKKVHVVCSLGSVAASGAYYIASACDKIVTNPGTITGSIGVIMEFANLGGLYQWAKVDRYVVKSGNYKDIGSEFRPMRPEERQIIQGMIDNVHMQFKKAIATGRNMKLERVSGLADGRIFSGEQAVNLGLADSLGGLEEAVDQVAKLAGIKGEPEIITPPPKGTGFIDFIMQNREDEEEAQLKRFVKGALRVDLVGKPLMILPGALGSW
ncbi:MAG: signal peptide peptidase SppA [Oligoflexia bacterium]|nr:signal peptide peptidase SppA [Oligoflexia bacterium]